MTACTDEDLFSLAFGAQRAGAPRSDAYKAGEIKDVTRVDGFHLVYADTYWKLRANLSRLVQQLRRVPGDQNAGVFDVPLDDVPGE